MCSLCWRHYFVSHWSTTDSVGDVFKSQFYVVDTLLILNRVLLNNTKSFYMHFLCRHNYTVNLRKQLKSKTQGIKFLGLHIDVNINSDDHLSQIPYKISCGGLGFIKSKQPIQNKKIIRKARRLFPDYNEQNFLKCKNFEVLNLWTNCA